MTGEVLTDESGNEFELRPVVCPTCGVAAGRFLGYRGGKYHRYGLGVATRIVRCEQCDLMFPDPFPFPKNPQRLYGDPDKYFEHFDEDAKVDSYRALARELARECGKAHPRVLDVGSGRAELIRAAKLEGLEAVGLEFSDAMIERARTRHEIVLLKKSIEEMAATSEMFDAVVLNAVLEHVYDPDSMIASAARLTRPGGILYIDIPQEPNLLTWIGNALSRLRSSEAIYNLSPTWPPFHVFGFNQRALRVLLSKHHFSVLRVHVGASPEIGARETVKDRLAALVATQINRVANWTGTASNMVLWARRGSGATG